MPFRHNTRFPSYGRILLCKEYTYSHHRSTLQAEDWAKLLMDVKARVRRCKEFMDVFISQDRRAGMLLLKEALEQNDDVVFRHHLW